MRVDELSGAQLDYWVAKAEGLKPFFLEDDCCVLVGFKSSTDPAEDTTEPAAYAPSVAWEDGGPIIEREAIGTFKTWDGIWMAAMTGPAKFADFKFPSATLLEAAMRCYVASRFGEEVDDESI